MERYRVGDLLIDVPSGAVTRDEQRVHLPPLTFNLLLALVRRAPGIVRRQQLLDTVWPCECVSDAALSQRVSLLRHALGESADEVRYIGVSRGWGYSVVSPVEKLESVEEPLSTAAVLPFVTLSADTARDCFADGLTYALIVALSRVPGLKVNSRQSAMLYRHSDKRPPQIGRELGVQVLVEGSILRSGERVWISAQLVHAATDTHIWAKTYQRGTADLLSVMDEMAESVAHEIATAMFDFAGQPQR